MTLTSKEIHSGKKLSHIRRPVIQTNEGFIRCVRWNPTEEMIISTAADDGKACVFDFKAEKVLCTVTKPEGGKL